MQPDRSSENSYHVQLKVFNQLSQEVDVLINATLSEGFHEIDWDGKDMSGTKVPEGIYIYRLIVTSENLREIQTRKLVVN